MSNIIVLGGAVSKSVTADELVGCSKIIRPVNDLQENGLLQNGALAEGHLEEECLDFSDDEDYQFVTIELDTKEVKNASGKRS